MSASANVLQLVRAHYEGNHKAFADAALALARSTKIYSIKNEIESKVRNGSRVLPEAARRGLLNQPPQFKQLPSAQNNCPFLQPLRPQTFAELLLPEHLQREFDQMVVELEYRQELAERGLRARDRILLHGTPGNGKTSCATAIASALDITAYGVSLPDLIDRFVGGTGQNIGQLFKSLTHNTLVVFDEIDAIGTQRTNGETAAGKEQNNAVNTFLTLMDRNDSGIIIATTNRIDILDPALIRRFEEVIEIPSPSVEQKRLLATRLCDQFKINPVNVDDCENFDAVTKLIKREARRIVMAEILAQEAESDEGNVEEQEDSGT